MRVAITGATGLVGRACVDAFHVNGHQVVRLLRRPVAKPRSGCADVIAGELGSQDFEIGEVPPCDVFVHAAARVPRGFPKGEKTRREFFRDNLNGTRDALRLCAASGARRFIFLSSIKVNGERTLQGRPFKAEDSPAPGDVYAASKLAAETLIGSEASAVGIDYAIVRAPLVYGRRVKGNFSRLARLARSGIPLPFAGLTNHRAMISDRNLADLVVSIACHDGALSAIVLACDPEQLSTPMLLQHLAHATGRRVRLWHVPASLLGALRILPGIGGLCSRLVDNLEIDLNSNPQTLRWQPPYATARELARAAASRY